MYDYSKSLKESKKYIKDYKIEGEYLIILFANGDTYKIKNTKEARKRIDTIMDNQLASNKNTNKVMQSTLQDKITKKKNGAKISLITFILGLALTLGVSVTNSILLIISFGSISILSCLLKVSFEEDIKEYQIRLKELKKEQFYLEEKDLLNNNIHMNSYVLLDVDTKTKMHINNKAKDENVFTLNELSNLRLEDLKRIRDNIKRELKFKKDILQEEKEKVYIKRK